MKTSVMAKLPALVEQDQPGHRSRAHFLGDEALNAAVEIPSAGIVIPNHTVSLNMRNISSARCAPSSD
jgi:hypothetical protein